MHGASGRRPILVVGGTGQIGYELVRALDGVANVVAPTRDSLDLKKPESIRETVRRISPAAVVNAAAYTAVDRAETERELCFAVNAEGPRVLAEEAAACGALMVQYSTDYVFDGTKRTPYLETDTPAPLNVYGESKLAGEGAVQSAGGPHIIMRTSWVYGPRGTNFVRTVLRLARERPELRIVADQTGAPTSSSGLANATVRLVSSLLSDEITRSPTADWSGIYHVAAAGAATWFEFARAVLDLDRLAGEQLSGRVIPISTAEYATLARRPAFSVLDCSKVREHFGITLSNWRDDLERLMRELV
jgi:dTDP-4-dehydrorhamnose reductase